MTRTSALPASIYFSARLNPVRKNGAPLDWRDWSLLIGHGQLRLASPRRTPSSLAELQYSEYVSFCTCVSITEILRDIRTRGRGFGKTNRRAKTLKKAAFPSRETSNNNAPDTPNTTTLSSFGDIDKPLSSISFTRKRR
jgi:hypothetical protein